MYTQEPRILEGTPGLTLEDTVHMMIPGRGRSADGESISEQTIQRVKYAATLYTEGHFAERSGVVVCSGYKTPAESLGIDHIIEDDQGRVERFVGMPEADSAADFLIPLGVPRTAIRRERHSIDTVTNFARSEREGHFGINDHPVAIVAQESHLERMIKEIAPRTLKRPYLGVVVPEEDGKANVDGRAALLVTKFILRGITPETPDMIKIVDRRARMVWAGVNLATKFKKGPAYNTEAAPVKAA
jgi:uncharacterized SAM-binding protein YcdF (DUF218 family)